MASAFLLGKGLLAFRELTSPWKVEGEILGASSNLGHRLREGGFPAPSSEIHVPCVIIGGGVAGLSSAWWLRKNGFDDFLLLELEDETGGNSRSGENALTPYPWGAHYVPIPGQQAALTRELFEELGVIEGYDSRGLPIYNELYLCSEPQERLLIRGHWQEGLVPQFGVSARESKQTGEFLAEMARLRATRGADGRFAFSIPIEESSRDPRFLALDRITMAEYLKKNGWDSESLRWYVNYCCRDDYGCGIDQVSAWAGVHYFASRGGDAANAPSQAVLTWPEGNGWLARKLREKAGERIRTRSLVFNIEQEQGARGARKVKVDFWDAARQRSIRVIAGAAIFSAPRFVAARVLREWRERPPEHLRNFSYAPWMVANASLRVKPGGAGAPLSWDNVSYESESLGYVVATHQRVARYSSRETVLTYYLPLSDGDPVAERKRAFSRSHADWARQVAGDLSRMHPEWEGFEKLISRIDVWLWGHGMIRPVPDFIWGQARRVALKPVGNIFFAHSDMSGISIFEEAQFRGVCAARQVLKRLSPRGLA